MNKTFMLLLLTFVLLFSTATVTGVSSTTFCSDNFSVSASAQNYTITPGVGATLTTPGGRGTFASGGGGYAFMVAKRCFFNASLGSYEMYSRVEIDSISEGSVQLISFFTDNNTLTWPPNGMSLWYNNFTILGFNWGWRNGTETLNTTSSLSTIPNAEIYNYKMRYNRTTKKLLSKWWADDGGSENDLWNFTAQLTKGPVYGYPMFGSRKGGFKVDYWNMSFISEPTPTNITINLELPRSGATERKFSQDVNYVFFTKSLTQTIQNCSLFTNESGTFARTASINVVTNNTNNTIVNATGRVNLTGTQLWNIECCTATECYNSSTNQSFILNGPTPSFEWKSPTTLFEVIPRTRNFSLSLQINGSGLNATTFYLWNESGFQENNFTVNISSDTTAIYNYTFQSLTKNFYLINATHETNFGGGIGSSTITLADFQIDNCTNPGFLTANFTVRNETSGLDLTADIETVFEYQFTDNLGNVRSSNYSNSLTASNAKYCIFPNGTTIESIVLVSYAIGTTFYSYDTALLNFSNQTRHIILYATQNTEQVTFNVKDTTGNNVEDAIIKVEKYDVGTNTFKTVEILKTGTDGNALGQIVRFSVFYRFTVEINGVVKLVDGPSKVLLTNKNFIVDLIADDWYEDYEVFRGVTHSLVFDNTTKIYTFTWNDPSLQMDMACLRVTENTPNNFRVISDTCVVAPSGTINVAIDVDVTEKTFTAVSYLKFDSLHMLKQLVQDFFSGWDPFRQKGLEYGVFLTFFVAVAGVMIGIWNPVASMAAMILAIWGSSVIGLYIIRWPMIVILIFMGGTLMWRMGKAQ